MEVLFTVIGSILLLLPIFSQAVPIDADAVTVSAKIATGEPETLSYSKLVQDQTDKIKQILAAETLAAETAGKTRTHLEYPVVTKKDESTPSEKQESLEKLRIRCEHFFKTFKNSKKDPEISPSTEAPLPATTEPEPTAPPVTTVTEFPYDVEETRTFDQIFRRPAQRIAQIPAPKNYISLRPLLLHKTVLNGRTYYYLYNKQIVPEQKPASQTEVVPQYEIEYNQPKKPQQPTRIEPLYQEQYKFVFPYNLKGVKPESGLEDFKFVNPYDQIDEFAYYPKHLQPSLMSIPMPYRPTWHMIRKLTIPTNSETNTDRKVTNTEPEIVTEIVRTPQYSI